ncbi:hypothetical protein Bcp1_212 [Bacillus phage Bcp1]|uniref:Uncharacterized protein n=1 Tax=Bacillus phage Bcp1 TaxID=584892 RepID=X2JN40_9CAUD|nr:hypothetical protein Bcp1_212 [Bacillus phage Bcp1]AHN66687.1 hypothetical protein Bcp1_212 [Bacillus phage Bcp1]AXQ67833.1 hypothetical protein KIOSHI_215 [Bacillus phage Kioshi]
MGNVKLMLDGKVIAEATSISTEVTKGMEESRTENGGEGITWVEACEFISKYLKEAHQIEMTGEQVFNASPTGELFHVFYLYNQAKAYYAWKDKQ